MNITYSKADVLKAKADVLVVPVFKDWKKSALVKKLDSILGGELLKLARKAGFDGGKDSLFDIQTFSKFGCDRLVMAGLGKAKDIDSEVLWDFAHKFTSKLRSPSVRSMAVWVDFAPDFDGKLLLMRLAQGIFSGQYAFDKYKTEAAKKNRKSALGRVVFYSSSKTPGTNAAKAAINRGAVIGEAVNIARDLVNEPAESMTPQIFASRARKAANEAGFTCKVDGEAAIVRKKMGLYMAVARGSSNPPRLVTMTYAPKNAKGKPIVLVGKGLMFDSGGYSLKPSASMETMKCDMAGSAAVLGAIYALAKLKVRKHVIAIVAACENMIGPEAYRVGDIYTGMNGKTVEVLNTDAEGRLTLADALIYAQTFKPELLVDLATLTGACVVALGEQTVGVFPSDEKVGDEILSAFRRAGEDAWPLPLNPRLKPLLKSDIADMKNVGSRWGGAITAALFLKEFVDGVKWAHLDIAGPAFQKSSVGHLPKGGSGVGVATLVELVEPSGK